MAKGVYTNKFHASYDYDAIDRDFDIFVLQKGKYMDRNILDFSIIKSKALAVQYAYGAKALVLFKKGTVDEFDYRMSIQDEFKDVKIKKLDIFDETERQENFYYNDMLLAQLLLNSMSNSSNSKIMYHNLTGKLFYSDAKWIKHDSKNRNKIISFYMLEAAFFSEMYLILSVSSFKLGKAQNERKYVFDETTAALRRTLKNDTEADTYIKSAYRDKRNTVDYLNIKNIDKFRSCKLGVLKRLLDDASKKLGNYMTLVPECITEVSKYEISKEQKKAVDKTYLANFIDAPLYIVDEIKTPESEQISERVRYEFKKYFGINAVMGEINENVFNIRIIHDKEHYIKNNMHDPHSDIFKNVIVQHITIENAIEAELLNDKDKLHPMVTKLLQELAIKKDILNRHITVFDWSKSGIDKDVTFVIREDISDKETGTQHKQIFKYTTLTISPSGDLKFESFADNDENLSENSIQIICSYKTFNDQAYRKKEFIDGLVFFSLDNIQAIIRTPMKTMPDINAISNGLEESAPDSVISAEVFFDALRAFENTYPEYFDYSKMLKNAFYEKNYVIKKCDINKAMNYHKYRTAFKILNEFLYENFGIRINPEMKSKKNSEIYMLNNIFDIKYYECINYEGRKEFRYYVGTKEASLKHSVHNACVIRKVISHIDEIEFKGLLPLLAVDFVRNNQYTVLPFPFKYLREALNML